MKTAPWLYVVLFVMGAGWGLSVPLSKIAVSSGHQPFGLIFWQLVVIVLLLGAIMLARGRAVILRWHRHWRLLLVVALCGAVLPDVFFYMSAARLPAGIMAIVIATVPMFSLPIALLMRNERFSWRRLLGLSFGLSGILLLVGPKASLPDAAMVAFVPVALLAPMLYATEGNFVAKWGTDGLDPMQVLFGASVLGVLCMAPVAVVSGQWIDPTAGLGVPELALVASAAIHALVYSCYVWMVGRAGSVFAAQTSYLVTGCGVLWSMLLLSERYSGWVWLALSIMLVGVFLVQPRAARVLVPGRVIGETDTISDQNRQS